VQAFLKFANVTTIASAEHNRRRGVVPYQSANEESELQPNRHPQTFLWRLSSTLCHWQPLIWVDFVHRGRTFLYLPEIYATCLLQKSGWGHMIALHPVTCPESRTIDHVAAFLKADDWNKMSQPSIWNNNQVQLLRFWHISTSKLEATSILCYKLSMETAAHLLLISPWATQLHTTTPTEGSQSTNQQQNLWAQVLLNLQRNTQSKSFTTPKFSKMTSLGWQPTTLLERVTGFPTHFISPYTCRFWI
jgi:hypothetical protein